MSENEDLDFSKEAVARDIAAAKAQYLGWCRSRGYPEPYKAALAAAHLAGRISQARKDAEMIEANTICYGSEGQLLRPRKDGGDSMGLPYAAALRAEADKLEKGPGE